MADEQYAGPLNFAVFALPVDADLGEITAEIQRLAASHEAEVLDVELVAIGQDGLPHRLKFEGTAAALAGAETDLLSAEDLAVVAEDLGADEVALVLLYEDRTLARLAAMSARIGGREGLVGGVDAAELNQVIGDES